MYAVVDAAEAFQADPNIMAIVLTGNEKAFAAGADIKEMNSKSYIEMQQADWFSQWNRFTAIRLPVIAAVNGYALGGGCELAMMADVMVAGPKTQFGQPEINLGVIPGMGGSQRLARSEEHTSELQSRGHLVCRLLLQKKNHHARTHDA